MTATTAAGASGAVRVARAGRSERAMLRHVARGTYMGAAVWGGAFGIYVLSSVLAYGRAYPTAADRAMLVRTFSADAGLQALIGRARAIDTVGGFTAWRSLGVLTLVGAVWAVLTATRLLRGEEERGRWELYAAGPMTRRRAAVVGLAGLAAGLSVMWAVTAALTIAAGRGSGHLSVPGCLFFATALLASPAVFLAVGAFTAQLLPVRRQAAMAGGAVLGASYLLRLLADSGTSTGWLRWLTPLGWIEEMRPLTGSRPVMLVPVAATVVVLAAGTAFTAGRRDLYAGLIATPDTAAPRTRLLSGSLGLAVRLMLGRAAGWAAAMGFMGVVTGLIARSAAEAMTSSSGMRESLERIGAGGGARAYLGMVFLMFATVLALAAAAQVAANREEEAEGHLDNLLARPLGRVRWLSGRLLTGTGALVFIAVMTGLGGWAGAAARDSGVSVGRMLGAGVNLVPAAVFVLGVGTLVHGLAPRAAAGLSYGLVGWSFLVELIGSVLDAPAWLLDLSLFHHLALAPAADPRWGTGGVLLVLGLAAAVLGAYSFHRRDLSGG